jgi:hypothetical protein
MINRIDLLEKQIGKVVFLPTCTQHIEINAETLTLTGKDLPQLLDMLRYSTSNDDIVTAAALMKHNHNSTILYHMASQCGCASNIKMFIAMINTVTESILQQQREYRFISGDISALGLLKNIRKLTIKFNDNLIDIVAIGYMSTLTDLSITNCISLENLTPIMLLPRICNISLEGCNKIMDLFPLSKLTTLKTLNLKGTGVVNQLIMKNLHNLTIIQ